MWAEGKRIIFTTEAKERGKTALSHAYVDLHIEAAAATVSKL